MEEITMFTDGSACIKPPKLGGCGVYIIHGEKEYFISKGYVNTKTGRMEIYALLYALRSVNKDMEVKVTIYSDSQYVVNSLTKQWVLKWQRNNWEGAKNVDLWKQVLEEIRERPKMKLRLRWIKGHQTNFEDELVVGNNMADMLADYKNHDNYIKDL
jgi:ribonuclease HI